MKSVSLKVFIFLLFVILFLLLGFLYFQKNLISQSSNKLKAFTFIEPIAFLAREIGGDFWEVQAILGKNQDYHTLDLKPSQIIALYQADIFLSLDNPEESSILEKLVSQKIKVTNISTGAKTIPFESGSLQTHSEYSNTKHDKTHIGHNHNEGESDPHTWLSIDNLSIFSNNICDIFMLIDPARKGYYQKNLKDLKEKLEKLQNRLDKVLAPFYEKSIIVMHPAYGYFLSPFHIKQISLESVNGGTSTFEIPKIIKEIKEHKAEYLFIQPQYDSSKAENLAKDLGLRLVKFNPIFEDPFKEIMDMLEVMSKNTVSGE